MSDLIDRQAAIDALISLFGFNAEEEYGSALIETINGLPSAEPEQDREFIKLTVRNPNGRPYYSIIYLEFDDNGVGHYIAGYSSYSLDVISDYLKRYFGFAKSAESERKTGKWIYGEKSGQDGWYCSECGGFIPWYYDFYGLDNIDFIEDFKTCPFCDSKMVSYTGANMKEGDIK